MTSIECLPPHPFPTYNIKPINICYIQLIMIIILLSTPKLEEIIWFVSICACLFVYKLLPELLHPYIVSHSSSVNQCNAVMQVLSCTFYSAERTWNRFQSPLHLYKYVGNTFEERKDRKQQDLSLSIYYHYIIIIIIYTVIVSCPYTVYIDVETLMEDGRMNKTPTTQNQIINRMGGNKDHKEQPQNTPQKKHLKSSSSRAMQD